MPWLAFVGPALRVLNKGVDFLANKSDVNPKASAAITLLGAAGTYFGIDPSSLAAIGKMLVSLGTVLQSVAG